VTHLWWYVARAGGIVAWALVAASVIWGLILSGKPFGKRTRPSWVLDLHRYLGGLALVFTGVHVAALVLDSYTYFGPLQLLVPFTSSYRPSAVAWGIVAMYLLVAVELTSLLRSRIPKRIWRRFHAASFPLFALSTLHGLQAGTDGGSPMLRWAMVAAAATVSALTALRLIQLSASSKQMPPSRSPYPPPMPPTRTAGHW
jgi:predicted ferric reductase